MIITQIGIAVFGVLAIFLSQQIKLSRRRWACIFGIASQPFWLYETYQAEQWGIFALSFLYAYSWISGFNNYWIKGAEVE